MSTRAKSSAGPSRHGIAVAYLALFCALSGGAIAAATIGSSDVQNNSLKSVDLKNNAGVKGADVRNGAILGGDFGTGSIAGGKFGADSLGGADVDETTTTLSRVVTRLGGTVNRQVASSLAFKKVPNTTYTQPVGESDQYIAGGTMTFPASCTQPRQFIAYLLFDDPSLTPFSIASIAQVMDTGAGAVTARFNFAPAPFGYVGLTSFKPPVATEHQFFVFAGGSCNSGAGITLDRVDIDVVGHR